MFRSIAFVNHESYQPRLKIISFPEFSEIFVSINKTFLHENLPYHGDYNCMISQSCKDWDYIVLLTLRRHEYYH
ncbi:MAG: hypothetical protein ABI184_07395 [Ginsengibacter sp.]